jgi:ABC-type transport system involved in Fe-S cluster assembly, permease component
VRQISAYKEEPDWMLDFRLNAYRHYRKRAIPTWGADLSGLNLDEIIYYARPKQIDQKSWDDVPDNIKNTFDRLGLPEAEQKYLAGVGAQYDSEMVYHNIQENLERQGVIFLSIENGLKQYPELFREHFASVVPYADNTFAALNSAVWSGGSFRICAQRCTRRPSPAGIFSPEHGPTSGSSNARSSSRTRARRSTTWKAAPRRFT